MNPADNRTVDVLNMYSESHAVAEDKVRIPLDVTSVKVGVKYM